LKLIFSQISYRDIQYRIIVLKKTIKTSITHEIFIYRYKKINSFDRCNLPIWSQATGRNNRGEIMTITSILIGHFNCRSQLFSI